MGTWHDAGPVLEFMNALPESTVLIYDEAYIEFAPASMQIPIDINRPNVMRMRTFSKAHGMAGARVGYVLAHQSLVTGMNKIRNHFGVNRIAQAGALASLDDQPFIDWVVDQVSKGRAHYAQLAEAAGLDALPSATNFLTIDMGGNGERARRMLSLLQERGVFVRMPGVPPLDRCIRVSVGTESERERFAAAFEGALVSL